MAATIEEKLWVLQEKLKETDSNLSVCIVLLQQYLRHEQYSKRLIVFVAVLALSAAKEQEKKQSKRGVLDLGYGIPSHGSILSEPGLSLGHSLELAAPVPSISYAAPAPLLAKSISAPALSLAHSPAISYASAPIFTKSYASPALSYGASSLSYASPLSYSAPSLSYAAPALSYAAPAPVYAKSIAAPSLSYASPALYSAPSLSLAKTAISYAAPTPIFAKAAPAISYAAPAPLIAKAISAPILSYSQAPLSLGYGSSKLW